MPCTRGTFTLYPLPCRQQGRPGKQGTGRGQKVEPGVTWRHYGRVEAPPPGVRGGVFQHTDSALPFSCSTTSTAVPSRPAVPTWYSPVSSRAPVPGKKGCPPHSCFKWKLTHITLRAAEGSRAGRGWDCGLLAAGGQHTCRVVHAWLPESQHSPLNHTKAVLLLHAAPVCGVEGLLHAVSVVDVNVDVQHTAGGQPKGGGR
jgi:hypothetical protein